MPWELLDDVTAVLDGTTPLVPKGSLGADEEAGAVPLAAPPNENDGLDVGPSIADGEPTEEG